MPMVQSKVNGLRIFIPAVAKGIIGRFATQNGNELVFVKPTAKNSQAENEERLTRDPSPADQPLPPAQVPQDAPSIAEQDDEDELA